MRRWRRPYPLDAHTALAMANPIVAPVLAGSLVVAAVHGTVSGLFLVLGLTSVVVFTSLATRRAMLGVFVSDTGIRSRSFFSTETVPWSSVADIRNGAGGNEGFNPGRDAIHIHLTDGTEIVTPVRRGNRLPPRLFRIEVGRVVMWPKPYDDALILLRRQLAEARRAAAA